MTAKIGRVACAIARPGTELVLCQPAAGPVSIEGYFDDAIATVGVLEQVRRGITDGCDGHVIACFGDPGLYAARELSMAPVVGIAEAAFHMATLIATRFSIITTLTRTRTMADELSRRYGMRNRCAGIRAIDISVLELEEENPATLNRIIQECRRARDDDGAGALVLGCAGMTDLAESIRAAVDLPVVDGVTAAIKLVESLVDLKLATSKKGDFALPIPKAFTGHFSQWGSRGS